MNSFKPLHLRYASAALLLSCIVPSYDARAADGDLQALEAKIVDRYSNDDCVSVNQLAAETSPTTLRPNIIAISATCAPSSAESERLFKLAEERDPNGDLIATLHALTLSKSDPEAAKPHWIQVLMYARSDSLRDLARESLSGIPPRSTPLNLSPWTFTANARLGVEHHSDAWSKDLPWRRPGSANSVDSDVYFRAQHWLENGSGSVILHLQSETFPTASSVSTSTGELQIPRALRVGPSEDLVFSLFSKSLLVGNASLNDSFGFGFSGIAYRGEHKQTVSGFVAADFFRVENLTSPHQSHYHFDYEWEWFPSRWLLDLKFAVDNHSASRIQTLRISDRATTTGDFNQTHNDLGLNFRFRYGFDRFSLGMVIDGLIRLDTQDSTFTELSTGKSLIKRRNDTQLALEPHVLFRAGSHLQFYGYYRRAWVSSSINPSDYGVDLGHSDSVVGLSLRTYWSSY